MGRKRKAGTFHLVASRVCLRPKSNKHSSSPEGRPGGCQGRRASACPGPATRGSEDQEASRDPQRNSAVTATEPRAVLGLEQGDAVHSTCTPRASPSAPAGPWPAPPPTGRARPNPTPAGLGQKGLPPSPLTATNEHCRCLKPKVWVLRVISTSCHKFFKNPRLRNRSPGDSTQKLQMQPE